MKCPYRKITERIDSGDGFDTHEYFAECYGEDCPLYETELKLGTAIRPAFCKRAETEK